MIPNSSAVREAAARCGFELAGVAAAGPAAEAGFYRDWVAAGYAGEMGYLADHRADLREDVRRLLPSARSVICVGKLYNTPFPFSDRFTEEERGWISRYAWGDDYHDILRDGLTRLAGELERVAGPFEWRVCVDTAPVLERALARRAGLGWIGKNSCLINQMQGSWFFLGELLVSIEIAPDAPPPDRCGSCRRCIDACPTAAIVPTTAAPGWTVDSRLCISYHTIELRGPVAAEHHAGIGLHVFGCDICQEVCPWNRRAPVTGDRRFYPREVAPPLEKLAAITEDEFRAMFRGSPVRRAKYEGFRRNVEIALANRRGTRREA